MARDGRIMPVSPEKKDAGPENGDTRFFGGGQRETRLAGRAARCYNQFKNFSVRRDGDAGSRVHLRGLVQYGEDHLPGKADSPSEAGRTPGGGREARRPRLSARSAGQGHLALRPGGSGRGGHRLRQPVRHDGLPARHAGGDPPADAGRGPGPDGGLQTGTLPENRPVPGGVRKRAGGAAGGLFRDCQRHGHGSPLPGVPAGRSRAPGGPSAANIETNGGEPCRSVLRKPPRFCWTG